MLRIEWVRIGENRRNAIYLAILAGLCITGTATGAEGVRVICTLLLLAQLVLPFAFGFAPEKTVEQLGRIREFYVYPAILRIEMNVVADEGSFHFNAVSDADIKRAAGGGSLVRRKGRNVFLPVLTKEYLSIVDSEQ